MVISGSTNVNSFDCIYQLEDMEKPIQVVYERQGNRLLFSQARLRLQNTCFDCGGRGINRDFRELLKTAEYPRVGLELLYAEIPDQLVDPVQVGLRITLAGVSRDFHTELICDMDPDLCIYGDFPIQLSDFDLEPPSKALGMIRVNDRVEVRLNLRLRQL